jgi:hypothetical protein
MGLLYLYLYLYLYPRSTLWNHSVTEYSDHEFENFVIDTLIEVIGKIRRCNADRSIGTS